MTWRVWLLAFVCFGFAGCDSSNDGVDAADAKNRPDDSRVNAIREMMRSVARTYPSPELPRADPWNVPSFVVSDFVTDGVIELEGGRLVRLDGLTCSADGVALLRRILLTPGTKVAVVMKSDSGPSRADVWTVEHPTKSYGPSFVGDFAVTSGACTPDVSSNSDNLPRYTALFEGVRRIDEAKR
jgi:hypothetical protein